MSPLIAHRRLPARAAWLAVLAMLLPGCATGLRQPLPEGILMPPPGDLQLVEARQAPERHRGARVRWGGTVVATRRDDAGNTRVEVVERRLDDRGRPRPGSASDGRFVILAAPEVDSSLYLRGNEITVAGILDGTVDGSIGEQPQHFPVVRVEDFVRWESRWPYHAYDPWYGPRVRFGVGIGHYRHHHGHYHGHPYWW